MLEYTLEDFVEHIIYSMTSEMVNTLKKAVQNSNIDSFQTAYAIGRKCMEQSAFRANNGDIIKWTPEFWHDLEKVAAAYTCYLGMDYIFRNEHPEGTPLGIQYLKKVYKNTVPLPVDLDIFCRSLYASLKQAIPSLRNALNLPGSDLHNPYILKKEKERRRSKAKADNKKYFEPHLYLNNIPLYLKKSFPPLGSASNINMIRDLTPSVTIAALSVAGAMPNGYFTNRSTDGISYNTISKIDSLLYANSLFRNKEIPKLNLDYIEYSFDHVKDPDYVITANILNLAVLDDVFRIQRFHNAMDTYYHFLTDHNPSLTVEMEEAIAYVCSLLLNIPIPLISHFREPMQKLIYYISQKDKLNSVNYLSQIMEFSVVTFPYMIGIICATLYSDRLPYRNFVKVFSNLSDMSDQALRLYYMSPSMTKNSLIQLIQKNYADYSNFKNDGIKLKSRDSIRSIINELQNQSLSNSDLPNWFASVQSPSYISSLTNWHENKGHGHTYTEYTWNGLPNHKSLKKNFQNSHIIRRKLFQL